MGKSAAQKAVAAAKAAAKAAQKETPVVPIPPNEGAVVKPEEQKEIPRVETPEASEGATAPLQSAHEVVQDAAGNTYDPADLDQTSTPSPNPPTETGVTVPPEATPPVDTTNPQTTEPPTPPSAQAPAAVEVATITVGSSLPKTTLGIVGYVTDKAAFDGVPRYILPEPPNVR